MRKDEKGFIDNRTIYEKAYQRAQAKMAAYDFEARENEKQIVEYVTDHKEASDEEIAKADTETKEIKKQIRLEDEVIEKVKDESEKAVN